MQLSDNKKLKFLLYEWMGLSMKRLQIKSQYLFRYFVKHRIIFREQTSSLTRNCLFCCAIRYMFTAVYDCMACEHSSCIARIANHLSKMQLCHPPLGKLLLKDVLRSSNRSVQTDYNGKSIRKTRPSPLSLKNIANSMGRVCWL